MFLKNWLTKKMEKQNINLYYNLFHIHIFKKKL